MERSITLRNVCACGIAAALEALVKEVKRRLEANHHPCPNLMVHKVENSDVPLCVTIEEGHGAWGIFEALPNPLKVWGDRLLGVSVQLCPTCPCRGRLRAARSGDQDAGHCHALRAGRCHGCTHACGSEVTVYMTHMPGFPVPPVDVAWFLYKYYNMHDLAAAVVPDNYRFLQHVADLFKAAAPTLSGPAAPETPDAGRTDAPTTPQPAVRGKPGAPQLDCNVWLYKTMCAMPDPRAYGHLRPEWQERYLQQMGVEPVDLDKSFREAARHYLHRILRDCGELDAGGQEDEQENE